MWEFSAKKTDRLDRLLREEELPGAQWLSRQAWDWLFENGRVYLNERKVGKSGQEAQAGSKIRVELPEGILGLAPASSQAHLVWSSPDQTLGLFHKPCGIPTLPLLPWDHTVFANQVAAFVEAKQWMSAVDFASLAEPPRLEGGVLQRLDRDTSGLLLVAFTKDAKHLFRQLFSRSAVEKTYLAIVQGSIDRLRGKHHVWLQGSGGAKVKAMLEPPKNAAAKPSVLNIEICHSLAGNALVKVCTRHGERHVVRASLAALGCPLLGDSTYGGSTLAPFHQLHALNLKLLEPEAFPDFPQNLNDTPPQTFLDSLALLGLHLPG